MHFNYFLFVALVIIANILIYNNTVQIKTNLILKVYKNFAPIWLHTPFTLKLLLSQVISLYILCPIIQMYNYVFMQFCFKSNRKNDLQTKTHFYIFYIYLCCFLCRCFVFLHVDSSYFLFCFYFSLKNFF